MKKILLVAVVSLVAFSLSAQQKTLYDFTVTDIDGNSFDMGSLRGKKVLIVNTASKCGYTPQYEDLQALYLKYGDRGFVVVGFPANNFRSQEPGNNNEIREFCTENYEVTFPMMAKIDVKGDNIAEIYRWLTSKSDNGVLDAEVKWNFQKFMIGRDGRPEGMIEPARSPFDPEIVEWLEKE